MKTLFTDIQARLKDKVPALKWIDQDYGQLENYGDRPAVLWPCCLLNLHNAVYTDMGQDSQHAIATISLRVAFSIVQHTNTVTPTGIHDKALECWDVIADIHTTLQGWRSGTFGVLSRSSTTAERRNDPIRVYEITYTTAYEEYLPAQAEAALPTRPQFTL